MRVLERLAYVLNIGRKAARLILTDNLGMRRVNVPLVSKELNLLQKDRTVQ